MSATAIAAPTLPSFRLMTPPIGCGDGAPSAPLNVPNATRPALAVPAAEPHGNGHGWGRSRVGTRPRKCRRDFTQSRDPKNPWRTRPNNADWYSFAAASGAASYRRVSAMRTTGSAELSATAFHRLGLGLAGQYIKPTRK